MARDGDGGGGGFGWGFIIGGAIGAIAGAYLASGPGREQVDNLRTRTIELTSSGELGVRARQAATRVRTVAGDPEHPIGKAVREGVAAARRRRAELESQAPTTGTENGTPEA